MKIFNVISNNPKTTLVVGVGVVAASNTATGIVAYKKGYKKALKELDQRVKALEEKLLPEGENKGDN